METRATSSNYSGPNLPEVDSYLKLANLSSRCSSIAGSARDSTETPDLLRSVKNLKEKISRLEEVRCSTDEKVSRLVRATDDYTNLLSRKPTFDDFQFNDSDSVVDVHETSDLLDDEIIRQAFDRLTRRVSQLEGREDDHSKNYMNRTTSMHSFLDHKYHSFVGDISSQKQQPSRSNSRHVSEVEKGRGTAVATPRIRDLLDAEPTLPSFYKDRSAIRQSRPRNREKEEIDYQQTQSMTRKSIEQGKSIGQEKSYEHQKSIYKENSIIHEKSIDRNKSIDLGKSVGHEKSIDRSVNVSNENVHLSRSMASLSSVGSSLRPLNNSQMSKLKSFQDNLRNEVMRNQEKFGFSPPKRLADLEKSLHQRDQSCARCGSAAGIDCLCKSQPQQPRMHLATASTTKVKKQAVVPRLSLPMDDKEKDVRRQLMFGRKDLAKKPARKEVHGTQTSFSIWKPIRNVAVFDKEVQTRGQVKNRVIQKRPSSAPSTPMRSYSGRSNSLDWRAPPFVTGKSTGPSHSVLVNLQQLLALLKVQNPFLYQACRNLDEDDKSLVSLAEVFQRELGQLLRKRTKELKQLLIDYDATSISAKSDSVAPDERARINKQLKQMARNLEMKDLDIERVRRQLKMLGKLREEALLLEQHHRPCHLLQIVTSTAFFDSNGTPLRNFAKPTASTVMKSAPAKPRSKSATRTNDDNVRALRDVKMITNAMGAC